MNLKDIKPTLKEPEKSTTIIYKDPYEAASAPHRPMWSRQPASSDDLPVLPHKSMHASARIAEDLKQQLMALTFHGFTDTSMRTRICAKCLKPVSRELGCCRLHAIWVCFDCWDAMVKLAYQFPKRPAEVSLIIKPQFERKPDGHLGAIED